MVLVFLTIYFFHYYSFFKKSKRISDKKLKEFEENKNYIVSDFNYIPIDLLFELTMQIQ